MKLVFIYGPPASGKLSVARELAKLTGFRQFDNHVSIQFVQSIFEFGTAPFWRLVHKYRLEMIEEAAKHRIDIIFTFVYERKSDDPFIRKIIRKVERFGGTVYFVRLQCGRKELGRRVTSKSRKLQGKLASKKLLNMVLRKFDLGWEVPFRKSLTINTEANSPRRAAKIIAEFYGLRASK
jgi:hypothetical protein